jgi:hypothetical protein
MLGKVFRLLKLAPRDAEVIFDRAEPVGRPTDMVLPARRWFGRKDKPGSKSVHAISPLKRVV